MQTNRDSMNRNGMKTFTFHTEDKDSISNISGIDELVDVLKRAYSEGKKLIDMFKELADSLMALLGSTMEIQPKRGFVTTSEPIPMSQLEGVGIKTWKLTETHTIKFRQKYRDIPVYGAIVTVEVGDNYDLIAINSAIGDPIGIDAHPKYNSHQLKDVIYKQTKHDLKNSEITPTLYYYFDTNKKRWRLVYLVENHLPKIDSLPKYETVPEMVDYVIDAHTGELVSELPRIKPIR